VNRYQSPRTFVREPSGVERDLRRSIAWPTNGKARLEVLVYAGLIAIPLFFFGWELLDASGLEPWVREDGVIESATALLYGVSTLLFLILAFRSNSKKTAFFLILWALLSFVIMGEEISWGQRIFGFETPEGLADINKQKEFNLHNIVFISDTLNSSSAFGVGASAYSLFFMIVGVVLPILRDAPWLRSFLIWLACPVIPPRYAVVFLSGLIFGFAFRGYHVDVAASYEVREFIYALGIFSFSIHGLFRPQDLFPRKRDSDALG